MNRIKMMLISLTGVIDEKHPVVKKLKLDENQIKKRKVDEGIPYKEKPTQPHKSFTVE